MFTPSPRSSKRQKLNQDATQDRNVESARGDTSPIDGNAIPKQRLKRITTTRQDTHDVEDGTSSNLVDSAYHSVGTSEEVDSREESAAVTNGNPEHGTANMTPSRKRRKRGDASDEPESRVAETVDEDEHAQSTNDEGVVMVRTSGRARTKTWKSAAIEAETKKPTAQHKLTKGDRDRQGASPSVSTRHKKGQSKRLPMIADSPTTTPTRKKGLRMPSKHLQPIVVEEDPEEDSPAESPTIEGTVLVQQRTPTAKRNRSQKFNARTVASPEAPDVEAQASSPIQKPKARVPLKISKLSKLLADDECREIMVSMKEHILRHLTGTGSLPLYGEDHHLAYRKVYQILEQTVSAGEGNSMLLIGARGTAKTILTNTAIHELTTEFQDQFHVVRLNGFIHTDDKLALKEIWRQLGREMAVEDNARTDRSNYADTMASLLALLSQPGDLPHGEDNRTTSKSVIFILDEFDLFTTHSRQTLLYNLFDIAQSRKAPIAVIGLTTRIDIVESLEKRVKSRFSHRYTYISHPQSFSAYTSIIRAFLLASARDEEADTTNFQLKSPALTELQFQFSTKFAEIYREWSAYVEQLFANPSILLLLNRHYSQTKSPQAILNTFLLPIMKLPSLPELTDLLLNGLCPLDSNLDLLPSLSDACLALLIAAARLDIVCDTDTVTFNMAYDEYVRLAQRSRLTASASGMFAVSGSTSGGSKSVLSRDIALAAWEQLEELGLLLPIAGQGGYGQGQGSMIDLGRGGRLVRVDVGLEEIGVAPGLELGAMARWCKEI